MKKLLSLIFSLLLLTAVLSGCGADSALEEKVALLDEQLALLRGRVDALEAENAALKAMLSPSGDSGFESDTYAPAAEFFFEDWSAEDGILTVSGGFVRVSGLSMADGTIADIYGCDLVLYWGGMELSKDALILNPGEAADSFELELDTLRYTLPDFSQGDQLELNLEVILSDGTTLTAWGGSWEYLDGALIMIAG